MWNWKGEMILLKSHRSCHLSTRPLLCIGLALACALFVTPSGACGGSSAVEPMIPAREGDAAVREEFRAAQASDTAVAWKLFIARHPRHALAQEARRRLSANAPK